MPTLVFFLEHVVFCLEDKRRHTNFPPCFLYAKYKEPRTLECK